MENSTKDYEVVPHKCIIKITGETNIRLLSSDAYPIPIYNFDFRHFEDVGTEITYKKAILDVIGRLTGFSDVRIPPTQPHTRVRTMYLTNERGKVMDVALWGGFIDKFDIVALHEQSQSSSIVLACNGLQITEYRRLYGLKTYTGTRFHTDTAIQEIADYLHKYCMPYDGRPLLLNATQEMFGCIPQAQSLLPKRNPINLTLAELNALYLDNFTETLYQFPARIIQVINPFDWHYLACTQCHRKLEIEGKGFYCSECKMNRRHSVPWYRMRVHVADQTDQAQLMLLGKTAEMIVGIDSLTLKAEHDNDKEKLPQALLAIVNKAYIFTVSGKQPGPEHIFRSYTITRHDPVPDSMMNLLPEPILLIKDSSTQQEQTPAPQTPYMDKGKNIIPSSTSTDQTDDTVSKKRTSPEEAAPQIEPHTKIRRRLIY
ncbi:Replication protein A 70 kDa DNA-binding subunit [Rhynchospora pubera]|uniref:Replication protein A 70 kDa DNA-binding subunit n=1 Tax=Rhynchospora pubera TaxID=906938 RepID=A0AAV8BSK1_9POAL|nr:Replication protein A 70 kDa DNA-binding subunit [Rhynchospora pubera]